jgi:hypothetical protein
MMDPLWGEGKPWEDVTYHIHQQLMQNKKKGKEPTKEKVHASQVCYPKYCIKKSVSDIN